MLFTPPYTFDLSCDLVTWLLGLWTWQSTGLCTQPRCICVWNFVKLCQSINGKNVTIAFKHEYRRHTLMSGCDVIIEAMNIKNTFYVLICDVLSISYVKMKLSQIIKNLQNGRHFEVRVIFKTGSCTGSWVLHQNRPCHSLSFDILFDVLAQIVTELWLFHNLTYFFYLVT